MNTITVYFVPCEPDPVNGYNIQWRVFGSADPYTDAGNFTSSPAVFTDDANPDFTSYEGIIRADCTESGDSGNNYGNDIPWTAIAEESGADNSSCGTSIDIQTESPLYMVLDDIIINVGGSGTVELQWITYDRPNMFELFDNGNSVESTGWRGEAAYSGPWGASLSTVQTGTITFNPVAGHEYKIRITVGPADPGNPLTDGFTIDIVCI